jgi:hypothetical protein
MILSLWMSSELEMGLGLGESEVVMDYFLSDWNFLRGSVNRLVCSLDPNLRRGRRKCLNIFWEMMFY